MSYSIYKDKKTCACKNYNSTKDIFEKNYFVFVILGVLRVEWRVVPDRSTSDRLC